MIEKPKRPKKIPNQDNKQPQTIQELIRRYDLDNTKIYDFLDELVENINNKPNAGDGSVTGDTLPIGSVVQWTSDTFPENWLRCDGRAISRDEYPELFSVLGTTYGAGDGSTTFNLPELRARVPVGKTTGDTDFNALGKYGGVKELEVRALIGATHGNSGRIGYRTESRVPNEEYTYSIEGGNAISPISPNDINHSTLVLQKDGKKVTTVQPYTVVNFIIKAKQSAGVVATVIDGLNSTSKTDALSANQGKKLNEKIDRNSSYSTNEQVIGTWIDGKPIYRTIIKIGSVAKASKKIRNIANLNISLVIKQYCMAQMDGADYHWASNADCFVYNSNSSSVSYYNSTDATRNVHIILEYTKTTD